VAEALLEHEVLAGTQLRQIMNGQVLEPRPPAPTPAAAPPPAREPRAKEGERAGGLLPPPMAAPKPTS
jgi:hypothetical protein